MAARTTATACGSFLTLCTLPRFSLVFLLRRDIKPENVLLADRTPTTAVKLADFGLSAMLPQAAMLNPDSKDGNPKALLYDPVGTAYYVAPEVRRRGTHLHTGFRARGWNQGMGHGLGGPAG